MKKITLGLMYKILFLIAGNVLYIGFALPYLVSAYSDLTVIGAAVSIPLAIWANIMVVKNVIKELKGD
jgi:hypothetical protein